MRAADVRTEPALIDPRQPKGARRAARALARRGVARLLAAVEETTHGFRFRAAESGIAEGQPAFPADLYDGAAGVALALMDAHAAFGSARCRAAVEQVGDGLRESAPTSAPRESQGLYVGLGGSVLLQLRRARQWGDAGAGAEATRLGVLLREAPIQDADLLHGAAGTGLVHLAIHHAAGRPGDRAPLEAARRCVEYLRRTAATVDGGLGWPFGSPGERVGSGRPRPAPPLDTGFAHGTAGIAVFLLEAARSMPGDPLPRRLAAGAFRRLDRTAVWRGQTVAWPVSNVERRRRYHWCHGTTGIAQAYLARYRHAGDAEALRIARAAGLHTWGALCAAGTGPRDKYPCHCHGLGGALELFMDLHEQGAGGEWLHRAAAIGRRLSVLAGPGRGPSALGGDGCGLAYGTAGILRALLRLAGHAAPAPWVLDRARVAAIPSVAPRSPVPGFLRRGGGARRVSRRGAAPPRARSRLEAGPEIVPPIGARIHGVQRVALLGPEWGKAATRFARRFLAAPESEPLHRAARTVERSTRALRSRHADLLGPDALGLATHGRFLREVAGLALYGGATATPHRAHAAERAARRYAAALALCLARVEADRRGALAGLVGGRLVEVEPLGNDPHRGGQVAIGLRFEDGMELIYKPRHVLLDWFLAGGNAQADGCVSAAQMVNARLPGSIAGGLLPTHDLVAAGPWHGYAERLQTRPEPILAPDEERFARRGLGPLAPEQATLLRAGDEPRFWYVAGLLAGHALCFGVGDLHSENVVCGRSRSSPLVALHAVDLEIACMKMSGIGDTGLTPSQASAVPPGTHTHFGLQARPSRHCPMGAEEWALVVTDAGIRPAARPGVVASRFIPHAVQNADGSFGYGPHLCPAVRGLVDHWITVRRQAPALAAAFRQRLEGMPVRVLAKASLAYVAPVRRRQLGGPLWTGATDFQEFGAATPFEEVERRQIEALDIPYFFQRLGARRPAWVERPPTDVARAHVEPHAALCDPFWSVVSRYARFRHLAKALADLVAFGAPAGPFDQRDDELGVRVARLARDPRLRVAVAFGDETIVFRIEPNGAVQWWRS